MHNDTSLAYPFEEVKEVQKKTSVDFCATLVKHCRKSGNVLPDAFKLVSPRTDARHMEGFCKETLCRDSASPTLPQSSGRSLLKSGSTLVLKTDVSWRNSPEAAPTFQGLGRIV